MDNVKSVLECCIKSARLGERVISVFDLMYEGIEYPVLRDILPTLEERGEIEIIDIKTIRFTGEIRNLDGGKSKVLPPPETDEIDETYIKALEQVIQYGNASATFIQRKCATGYIKACKILDWMENMGYITPANGPWARKVLITKAEFRKKYNPLAFRESFNDIFDGDDDDFDDALANLLEEDDEPDEEDPFEALEKYQKNRMKYIRDMERKMKPHPGHIVKTVPGNNNNAAAGNTTADGIPEHPSWTDEFNFVRTVRQRMEEIVKSDKNMGVKGAIRKAEELLKEAKDKADKPLAEIYERLIFDFNHTTPYEYAKLKRKYFQ